MNKKIICAAVMLLVFAGAAAAWQPGNCGAAKGRCDGQGRPELTQEQKNQFEAMRKLRTELRAELSKDKPDTAKARSIFAKELSMKEAFRLARFNERLDKGAAFCKPGEGRGKPVSGDCQKAPGLKDGKRDGKREGRRGGDSIMKDCSAWKDLQTELRKENPDKAKAKKLYAEAAKFRRQKETERFEEILKNPKAFSQKKHRGPGGAPCADGAACGKVKQ